MKAEQALRMARPGVQPDLTSELYPAMILAANGDGYDVATVDAAGNIGRVYERIFAHPAGSTFAVNAEVWLWMPSDGETPVIMATGGGGSCYQGTTEWGVLFG